MWIINPYAFGGGFGDDPPNPGGTLYGGLEPFFNYVVNVKDFGATGDGVTDDSGAIQDALDEAFGPVGSPKASRKDFLPVYIPRGNYRCVTPLIIAALPVDDGGTGGGATIFGDGQKQTRLFYDGAATDYFIQPRYYNYSSIQGITFDGQDIALAVIWMADTDGTMSGGDSGGTTCRWFDVAVVNGVSSGIVFDQNALGSEQIFHSCLFSGHPFGGLVINSANALNHTLINCTFKDNGYGAWCITGGIEYVLGCFFENNGLDLTNKQGNSTPVLGCHSTSERFLAAGPCSIIGCMHITDDPSLFFSAGDFGIDMPFTVIESCYAPNSTLGDAGLVYLKGNRFDRADYLDDWTPANIEENI